MSFRVQIRRDPSGKWLVNNPILLGGEFGYETDTTFLKIGDGATTWNYLPYWEGGQGPIGPTGASGATYKVFTALLTQQDTSSYQNQTSGTFIIGVSYFIDSYFAGDDFSNVGGPAAGMQGEWDGYWFLATGTTPLVYTNGSIIEHNTGTPIVNVLENTLGFNPYFQYDSVGSYASRDIRWQQYYTNPIQTFINCGNYVNSFQYTARANYSYEESTFYISSFNDGVLADDVLSDSDSFYRTSLEIRVYN